MAVIDYSTILTKLAEDIESKTGIFTRYKIDNQDNGDTPTITIELVGTIGVTKTASKITKSHAVLFKLILSAKAANSAQIAEIIKAEADVTEVFPISLELQAVASERYALSEVSGYLTSYFTKWSLTGNEMQTDSYERKWDLIVEITQKR